MGAIEHADHTSSRHGPVDAPEEIVSQLFSGRLLERRHAHPLGTDSPQHITNRAIFASGVDCLKQDEQLVTAFGVKPALQLCEFLSQREELRFSSGAIWLQFLALGQNVLQGNLTARFQLMCVRHRGSYKLSWLIKPDSRSVVCRWWFLVGGTV